METGGAGDQGGGLVSLGWEKGPLIPEAGRLQELVLLQVWVGAGQGRSSRRDRPSPNGFLFPGVVGWQVFLPSHRLHGAVATSVSLPSACSMPYDAWYVVNTPI